MELKSKIDNKNYSQLKLRCSKIKKKSKKEEELCNLLSNNKGGNKNKEE